MAKNEFRFHSKEIGIHFYHGPAKTMMQSHRHPPIELNLLESGSMAYRFNQNDFVLRPKTLFSWVDDRMLDE